MTPPSSILLLLGLSTAQAGTILRPGQPPPEPAWVTEPGTPITGEVVEEAVPVEDAVAVEEVAPVEEAAEEAAPVEPPAVEAVEGEAVVEEAAAAEEAAAVEETAPVEEPAAEAPTAAAQPAPPDIPATPARAPAYRVGPGDRLNIQVYGESGLSGVRPIDDAGVLEFPLVGAVPVEGLTAAEVAALLRTRLVDGYIRDPEVTVSVDAFGSQPIQVLGAVGKPGTYYVRGTATVLQMLSEAGGVSREGVNEVRLTRGAEGGEVTVLPYLPLVSQGSGNLTVRGGDVIFVPESLVTVMGQVADPGAVAWREDLTISRCLAAVGGATTAANLGRVYILRGDQRIRVNVRRILRGKADDIPLQAGDQVFVQQSAL